MFRAIGFIIMLWAVNLYFGNSIRALDRAATESFRAIEVAAVISQAQLRSLE